MRSPGVVYRRYRQLRRKLLYKKIQESRKKLHDNCVYGKKIEYFDDSSGTTQIVRLCMYSCKLSSLGLSKNIDMSENLDICTSPSVCNAFACKWSKEKIEEEFNSELNNYSIKEEKYPELAVFEWILDKSLHDAQINPGWFGNLLVRTIIILENLLKNIRGSRKKLHQTK